MNERLNALAQAGVSIWLDDLSRARITSGNLAGKIAGDSVTGVTTNPTIFAAALTNGADYAEQLAGLDAGTSVDDTIKLLCTTDVRNACDLFADVYAASSGYDGRVSIEVAPTLANDTGATVAQAAELHGLVGRPNVLIKIPATKPGLPAIRQTIADGISVNVTLIFSEERYRDVMDAYLSGLEEAAEAGRDLSTIHSVASFFVSRVDSEIDKRLAELGGEAETMRGSAGVANAEAAFGEYLVAFSSERFAALKAQGANVQRPLWASTGVKNPEYPDTLYVDRLVADPSVNTMPEKTLDAVADHSELGTPLSAETAESGEAVLGRLAEAGIDLADVFALLEREGVEKFEQAWEELISTVSASVESARS